MKKQIFNIECDEKLHILAEKYFESISGLNPESRGYENKLRAALRVKELVKERLAVRAIIVSFDDSEIKFDKHSLYLDEQELLCTAFQRLDTMNIKGGFVFAVTTGDVSFPDESAKVQLFADFWGTAYVEAARDIVESRLAENRHLSDSFGPGYYGMDVLQMSVIDDILDMKQIGITVEESGMLYPVKSCAEIIFDVTDKYINLESRCMHCKGSLNSCAFCNR